MAISAGAAESLINDEIGCGAFQAILFIVVFVFVKVSVTFTVSFMAFGNYNPGWICLDNTTVTVHGRFNHTDVAPMVQAENETLKYEVGSCEAFNACRDVEFNPESSTIVTEWGLLCDRAWIGSLCISLQMCGMLVGSYIGGQLSDLIGRKKTMYGCLALGGALELISSFSVSWRFFVVLRFFLGACCVCNMIHTYLYVSEMMTEKWRPLTMAVPAWQIGNTLMALTTVYLKDWREIERAAFLVYVIAMLPVVWVPESLRWLGVKNKKEEFYSTVEKMAKLNGKELPQIEDVDPVNENSNLIGDSKKYTVIDLFRKGYRFITVGVGFLFVSVTFLYYALLFGVKSLHGDFYTNFILSNIFEIPFGVVAMLTQKYLNRRINGLLNLGFGTACIFTVSGLLYAQSTTLKVTVSAILYSIAKGSFESSVNNLFVRTSEMFPTVVRGISLGWNSGLARVGGLLAPFAIPNNSDHLFTFMVTMGGISFVCCVVGMLLPETKGKPLKEKF